MWPRVFMLEKNKECFGIVIKIMIDYCRHLIFNFTLNFFITVWICKNVSFYEYLSYRSKRKYQQKARKKIEKRATTVDYEFFKDSKTVFFYFLSMKTLGHIQVWISLKKWGEIWFPPIISKTIAKIKTVPWTKCFSLNFT